MSWDHIPLLLLGDRNYLEGVWDNLIDRSPHNPKKIKRMGRFLSWGSKGVLELNKTRDEIAQASYTYTKAYEQCLEWDSFLHPLPCPLLLMVTLVATNNMG